MATSENSCSVLEGLVGASQTALDDLRPLRAAIIQAAASLGSSKQLDPRLLEQQVNALEKSVSKALGLAQLASQQWRLSADDTVHEITELDTKLATITLRGANNWGQYISASTAKTEGPTLKSVLTLFGDHERWELFKVSEPCNGFALRNARTKRFLAADHEGRVSCSARGVSRWATWDVLTFPGQPRGTVVLRSFIGGFMCQVQPQGRVPSELWANVPHTQPWECFMLRDADSNQVNEGILSMLPSLPATQN